MPPVALSQLVRPSSWAALAAERLTYPLLLAPVFGAFFQTLIRHRVPSMGWVFLLMATSWAARLLKDATRTRERPAVLGVDGVLLDGTFVPAADLARVEMEGEGIAVVMRGGTRIELAGPADALARAEAIVDALREVADAPASTHDVAARIAAADASVDTAYRRSAVDHAWCLAVASDASAAPAARIAVAKRLADADETMRARIEDVAASTANPELRDELLAACRATHMSPSSGRSLD